MTKQARKDREDLRVENARLKGQLSQIRRYGIFSTVTKIAGEALRSARVIAPFCFAWLMVRELAGRSTNVDADVRTSVDVSSQTLAEWFAILSQSRIMGALAIAVGVGGILYGRAQAKLRKDDVEHLQDAKIKYEKGRDPGRTSSKLTTRGETRPEDE